MNRNTHTHTYFKRGIVNEINDDPDAEHFLAADFHFVAYYWHGTKTTDVNIIDPNATADHNNQIVHKFIRYGEGGGGVGCRID